MAAFAHTSVSYAPVSSRIAASVAAARDVWARHKLYRATVNELQSLTGRELADIGLNRSMIKSVAMEAASGAK